MLQGRQASIDVRSIEKSNNNSIGKSMIAVMPPFLTGRIVALAAIACFVVLRVRLSSFLATRQQQRPEGQRDPNDSESGDAVISAKNVRVEVFLEALCIDSKHFVLEQLVPTYEALGSLSGTIQYDVVAFGNAKISFSNDDQLEPGTVTCQHGDAECDANSYEQCVVSTYEYPSRYLPYVRCLFEELDMGYRDEPFDASVFAECGRRSGLDISSIRNCHDNAAEAWELQVKASARTPASHTFIPWVLLNGDRFDTTVRKNRRSGALVREICNLVYEGTGGGGDDVVRHPACEQKNVLSRMSQLLWGR